MDEDGAPFAYEGDVRVKLSSPCGLLECDDYEFAVSPTAAFLIFKIKIIEISSQYCSPQAVCTGGSTDPIGAITLYQRFTLALSGPIRDFSKTICVDIFVGSTNVSGRQAFEVNVIPGNPRSFELTEFSCDGTTHTSADLNGVEFRLDDQLQNVRFICFDQDGNLTYPAAGEKWFVEFKKHEVVHPIGRGVYKAEVVSRAEESQSCFEQLRLEFDESTVPLRGSTLSQAVTLCHGTRNDRIEKQLQFRVVRSRIPSSLEVCSE